MKLGGEEKMTINEWILNFIAESNKIEGIHREPTQEEIDEAHRFIGLSSIDIGDVIQFVSVYQPNASLRDKVGLDVFVGNHVPPKGGIHIKNELRAFLSLIQDDPLDIAKNPFLAHQRYESLHPFTDGNGRSGRIIWLWQMLKLGIRFAPLGFLQTFYYQSLDNQRK